MQGLNRDLRVNRDELTAVQGEIETTSNTIKALTTANLNASESTDKVTESTGEATESTKDLEVEVRTLTDLYSGLTSNIEKASETTQALSESQSETNDFFRLARGEVNAYDASIETVIPSVINLTSAEDALTSAIEANIAAMQTAIETGADLDVILSQLSEGLTSVAADQAIATADFNLVNPAISDAVDSMRDYNAVMGDVQTRFQDIDEISSDLTASIRTQGTAFDDLRSDVESAQDPFDDFQDTIVAIPGNVDLVNDAFDTFGSDTITVLNAVGASLGDLEGDIGLVATALGEFGKFAQNPVAFATNFFGEVIGELLDTEFNPEDRSGRVIQRFEGEGGFSDVGSTIDDAELANIRSILARPEGLEFLRQNFQGIFADPAVEALIREILPAEAGRLFDQERPSNVTRFDPQLQIGDTSRGSERVAPQVRSDTDTMYVIDPATDEIVPVTTLDAPLPGSEAGVPEPLRTAFRSTGEQRDALSVLQGDITNAENRVRLLTEDSSIVEVLLAYTNLSSAETAYYDQQIAFVDEGVGIFTDTALETARTRASQMLTDSAFDANQSLVRALGDTGFALVNAFSATAGFLNQTQLAIARIPEIAAEVAAEVSAEVESGEIVNLTAPDRAAQGASTQSISEPITPEATDTSLQRNALNRARFGLTTAGDEQEFESRQQTLVTATNAFYDAELVRIAEVGGSERELQNSREDNALNREQALYRIANLENSFATQRVRDAETAKREEERLAEERTQEIERLAEEQKRAQEETQREALRLAEEQARAQERLAEEQKRAQEETQREALRLAEERRRESAVEAQNQVNLVGNIVERAQFNLRQATGEEDFEDQRDALILSTNAFYDLEDERISGLELSESRLQDLREDNALDREQALYRIDNLDNTFAEERIRREERIVSEQIRLAEEQEREQKRLDEERSREQERLAREQMQLAEETARAREASFNTQQRRDAQFAGIGLGAARSLDDLNIGLGRNIQDLLREALPEHLVGGTPSARELSSIFQPGADVGGIVGSDVFNRLFQGIGDPRRDFITEGIEDLFIPLGRRREDIGLQEGRATEDLEMQISLDAERVAFAMAIDTGGQQIEMSAINAGATLETSAANAGSSFETSVAAAGSGLAGAIASAIASAGGGGGAVVLMADGRQIAQVVNSANVGLNASIGTVGGGGGV